MSEATNEIREVVNAVLDCVDYCCDRFGISEEELKKIFDPIQKDILTPALKDVVLNSMQIAIWGEPQKDKYGRPRIGYRPVRNSRNYSKPEHDDKQSEFKLDDFYFPTADEANIVLSRMEDYANRFGSVPVGYLYEIIGESGTYTSEHYGWDALRLDHAKVVKERGGYRLVLPDPRYLEEKRDV